MSVAFRIRTQAGQELSFASRRAFEDFVRAGDLSPEDVVYDAETGSWSSALTHPIVLEIQYEEEEEARSEDGAAVEAAQEEAAGDEAPEADDDDEADDEAEDEAAADGESDLGLSLAPAQAVRAKSDDVVDPSVPEIEREFSPPVEPAVPDAESDPEDEGDLGLDLAPEEEVTAEEASRAFVEKMEAERAATFDFGGADDAAFGSLTMENRGSMADMISAAPSEDREPVEKPRPKPRPKRRPPPPPKKKSGGAGKVVAGVVVVVVLGGAAYFGLRATSAEPELVEPADTVVEPIAVEPDPDPGPQPVIATNESAVRARAQERYLARSQSSLRNLQPIPDVWSTAEYFTAPSAHADVLQAWEAVLVAVRTMRAGDRDRYVQAFEVALDDAVIRGEQRDERRGRALADFDSAAPVRAAHFDRVEALASAAIQSHNALIEVEGLILIDPSGASGIQDGIGEGAYGRDEDSQLLLDQVVDVLDATLNADGEGPGSGPNVREWVWGGFLDAVTSGS